ncbi:MAG TPA: hypothetical protein VHR45_08715 [Thermoanaerobaculia bacterium]|nr:hypothetical protein [Thermoanaerobaculia bacterium]
MRQQLAPCECGGKAEAKSVSYIRGRWFWIQCASCLGRSSDRNSLDEAVEEWNKRGKKEQKTATKRARKA